MISGNPPLRVLIADSQPLLRYRLRETLEHQGAIAVVAEARHGAEALQLASQVRPDLLVLAEPMPGPSGVELVRELRSQSSCLRLLFLMALECDPYAFALLRAGADGCFPKHANESSLCLAVERVVRGEKVLPPQLRRGLLPDAKTVHAEPYEVIRIRPLGLAPRKRMDGIAQ